MSVSLGSLTCKKGLAVALKKQFRKYATQIGISIDRFILCFLYIMLLLKILCRGTTLLSWVVILQSSWEFSMAATPIPTLHMIGGVISGGSEIGLEYISHFGTKCTFLGCTCRDAKKRRSPRDGLNSRPPPPPRTYCDGQELQN